LEGERVVLRDVAPRDVEPYLRAFADDPELAYKLGFEEDPTPASVRKMLRGESGDRARGEVVRFAIADRADDGFRGLVLLHSFSWKNKRADCGVFVAPAARGAGYALEALRLLVAWAFTALGLQRVGLATLTDNDATARLAERAGFRREGVLRAYTCERGVRIDNLLFGAVEGDPAWA
jgi:ribosomal-protein-alanine N-acetyltransferase